MTIIVDRFTGRTKVLLDEWRPGGPHDVRLPSFAASDAARAYNWIKTPCVVPVHAQALNADPGGGVISPSDGIPPGTNWSPGGGSSGGGGGGGGGGGPPPGQRRGHPFAPMGRPGRPQGPITHWWLKGGSPATPSPPWPGKKPSRGGKGPITHWWEFGLPHPNPPSPPSDPDYSGPGRRPLPMGVVNFLGSSHNPPSTVTNPNFTVAQGPGGQTNA